MLLWVQIHKINSGVFGDWSHLQNRLCIIHSKNSLLVIWISKMTWKTENTFEESFENKCSGTEHKAGGSLSNCQKTFGTNQQSEENAEVSTLLFNWLTLAAFCFWQKNTTSVFNNVLTVDKCFLHYNLAFSCGNKLAPF